MRIQWKFFIFLLVFSLVPLVVQVAFDHERMRRLGRTVTGLVGGGLTEIVRHDLRKTAEAHARILDHSKTALEVSLQLLAREAGLVLSGAAAGRASLPGGAKPANAAVGDLPSDKPGFFSPAGADPGRVATDEARLAALVPLLRELRGQMPGMIGRLRVYVAGGPLLTFPDEGAPTGDLDPAASPWYETARRSHETGDEETWNDPVVDPGAGRAVYRLSRPVLDAAGNMIGAAAIDVPMSGILRQDELGAQWVKDTEILLTLVIADPETGKKGLLILARQAYEETGRSGPVAYQWLISNDDASFGRFLEAVETEPSGFFEMPFQGRECFWAFARITGEAQFVIIAPKREALSLARQAEAAILGGVSSLLESSAGLALAAVAVTGLTAFFSARRFTAPIGLMVEAWRRLADGDFSARLDFRAGDERDVLATAFNETAPKLADFMRLSRSLELAQEVQRNLLPAAPPDVPGLDMAGVSLPCDETGGDYFDYFLSEGPKGPACDVVVGDVTGHGVASALLMATARAYLRAAGCFADGLAGRAARANRDLAWDVADSGRFMTLFWMEIPLDGAPVRFVRAGHDPTLCYDPRTGEFEELQGPGIPLGVIEDFVYVENEAAFDVPGSFLAFGTDGIWEARDVAGEMYGKERFREVLRRGADLPAKDMVAAALASLAAFRGPAAVEDDVTLVIVKRTTRPVSSS